MSRLKRKDRTEATVLARPVTIGDGADKHGTMAAYVERPGQFTALDHVAATRTVDRDEMIAEVQTRVQLALAAGALDEYTDDFLDAWIDERRAGWDAAAQEESRHRRAALELLAGMELHDLTLAQAQVADLRSRAATLEQRARGWRGVLLGQTWHTGQDATPDQAPLAPLAVSLDAALAAANRTRPAPVGDLALFEVDLAASTLMTNPAPDRAFHPVKENLL